MLGDGGSGKSWEIARWLKQQSHRLSLHVRGARLLKQKGLFRELSERPDFARWIGGEPLDIVIDGLDECTSSPLEVLESIADELTGRSMALHNLRLRVTCRSTVWNDQSLEPLTRIFGRQPADIRVIDLLPLRRADVLGFLRAGDVADADQRLTELLERDLGPVLARPMLLAATAKALRSKQTVTTLSLRRAALDLQLAGRECDESTRAALRAGAQRIAAVHLITRQSLDDLFASLDALCGPARVVSGGSWVDVAVTRDVLRALRRCSLFSGDESGPVWSHQSWAEFLCAEWVAALPRSVEERVQVLGSFGELQVLPEWADAVLSYLSVIDPPCRHLLVRHAPLALLRSDTTAFDAELSVLLVESMIELAKTRRARALDWSLLRRLRTITPTTMDDALASIIADRKRDWPEREVALMAAWRGEMPRCLTAAVAIALDPGAPDLLREHSAELIADIGASEHKAALLPLLSQTDAVGQRLSAAVLDAVWRVNREMPSIASIDVALDALVRCWSATHSSSSYWKFVSRFAATLHDDELATCLSVQDEWGDGYAASIVRDQLVDQSLDRLLPAPVLNAIVRALLSPDSTRGWAFRETLSSRLSTQGAAPSLAMKILEAAESVESADAQSWSVRLASIAKLVPLAWLYAACAERSPSDRWAAITAGRVADDLRSISAEQREAFLNDLRAAASRSPALEELTRWIFAPPAPRPLSAYEQQWRSEEEARRRRDVEAWERLQKHRAEWLARLPNDIDAFWRLIWTAGARLHNHHFVEGLSDPILSTEWWLSLTSEQRALLFDAAEQFLLRGDPMLHEWHLQSRVVATAYAGRCALEMLVIYRASALASVDWRKWMPVVTAQFPGVDTGETQSNLVSAAASFDRTELGRRALQELRYEVEQKQFPSEIRTIEHEPLPEVLDAIPSLLSPERPTNHGFELFSYLLRHSCERALSFARGLFVTLTDDTVHRAAVASLIVSRRDSAWRLAVDAMLASESLATAVLNETDAVGLGRDDLPATLQDQTLADALIVAARHAQRDPRKDHRLLVGSEWYRRVRDELRARASVSSSALAELRRVVDSVPDAEELQYSFELAEIALLEHVHRPRTLDELRALESSLPQRESVTMSKTPKSSQRLFTWLHLSDIHFGQGREHKQATQEFVMLGIPEAIERVRKEHPESLRSIDAVLVTGDIAFSGQETQYERALDWLRDASRACGVGLDRVFAVPGNHDVDMKPNATTDAVVAALRTDRARLATFWDTADIDPIVGRQRAFWRFAKKLAAVDQPETHFNGWWIKGLPLPDGRTLTLVGMNTALLSTLSDDKPTNSLALGQRQIHAVKKLLLDESRIVVLLSHHPFSGEWLADAAEDTNALAARAALHICGHIHEASLVSAQTSSGRRITTLRAGATQQAGADIAHKFALCSLIDDGEGLAVDYWPLVWNAKNDTFVPDPDQLGAGRPPARIVLEQAKQKP